MVTFAHDKSFNGTCAPLVYVLGCTKVARQAYQDESKAWLALYLAALLALGAATIFRFVRVTEGFNTLRLIMLGFLAGLPLYVRGIRISLPPLTDTMARTRKKKPPPAHTPKSAHPHASTFTPSFDAFDILHHGIRFKTTQSMVCALTETNEG